VKKPLKLLHSDYWGKKLKNKQMKILTKKMSVCALFFTLLFLSTKVIAQNATNPKSPSVISATRVTSTQITKSQFEDMYFSGVQFIIKNKKGEILVDKIYEKLTENEKKKYLKLDEILIYKNKDTDDIKIINNLPNHYENKKYVIVIE
jgi:N-acetylmuramoyl-L-alanine amidase CwlA